MSTNTWDECLNEISTVINQDNGESAEKSLENIKVLSKNLQRKVQGSHLSTSSTGASSSIFQHGTITAEKDSEQFYNCKYTYSIVRACELMRLEGIRLNSLINEYMESTKTALDYLSENIRLEQTDSLHEKAYMLSLIIPSGVISPPTIQRKNTVLPWNQSDASSEENTLLLDVSTFKDALSVPSQLLAMYNKTLKKAKSGPSQRKRQRKSLDHNHIKEQDRVEKDVWSPAAAYFIARFIIVCLTKSEEIIYGEENLEQKRKLWKRINQIAKKSITFAGIDVCATATLCACIDILMMGDSSLVINVPNIMQSTNSSPLLPEFVLPFSEILYHVTSQNIVSVISEPLLFFEKNKNHQPISSSDFIKMRVIAYASSCLLRSHFIHFPDDSQKMVYPFTKIAYSFFQKEMISRNIKNYLNQESELRKKLSLKGSKTDKELPDKKGSTSLGMRKKRTIEDTSDEATSGNEACTPLVNTYYYPALVHIQADLYRTGTKDFHTGVETIKLLEKCFVQQPSTSTKAKKQRVVHPAEIGWHHLFSYLHHKRLLKRSLQRLQLTLLGEREFIDYLTSLTSDGLEDALSQLDNQEAKIQHLILELRRVIVTFYVCRTSAKNSLIKAEEAVQSLIKEHDLKNVEPLKLDGRSPDAVAIELFTQHPPLGLLTEIENQDQLLEDEDEIEEANTEARTKRHNFERTFSSFNYSIAEGQEEQEQDTERVLPEPLVVVNILPENKDDNNIIVNDTSNVMQNEASSIASERELEETKVESQYESPSQSIEADENDNIFEENDQESNAVSGGEDSSSDDCEIIEIDDDDDDDDEGQDMDQLDREGAYYDGYQDENQDHVDQYDDEGQDMDQEGPHYDGYQDENQDHVDQYDDEGQDMDQEGPYYDRYQDEKQDHVGQYEDEYEENHYDPRIDGSDTSSREVGVPPESNEPGTDSSKSYISENSYKEEGQFSEDSETDNEHNHSVGQQSEEMNDDTSVDDDHDENAMEVDNEDETDYESEDASTKGDNSLNERSESDIMDKKSTEDKGTMEISSDGENIAINNNEIELDQAYEADVEAEDKSINLGREDSEKKVSASTTFARPVQKKGYEADVEAEDQIKRISHSTPSRSAIRRGDDDSKDSSVTWATNSHSYGTGRRTSLGIPPVRPPAQEKAYEADNEIEEKFKGIPLLSHVNNKRFDDDSKESSSVAWATKTRSAPEKAYEADIEDKSQESKFSHKESSSTFGANNVASSQIHKSTSPFARKTSPIILKDASERIIPRALEQEEESAYEADAETVEPILQGEKKEDPATAKGRKPLQEEEKAYEADAEMDAEKYKNSKNNESMKKEKYSCDGYSSFTDTTTHIEAPGGDANEDSDCSDEEKATVPNHPNVQNYNNETVAAPSENIDDETMGKDEQESDDVIVICDEDDEESTQQKDDPEEEDTKYPEEEQEEGESGDLDHADVQDNESSDEKENTLVRDTTDNFNTSLITGAEKDHSEDEKMSDIDKTDQGGESPEKEVSDEQSDNPMDIDQKEDEPKETIVIESSDEEEASDDENEPEDIEIPETEEQKDVVADSDHSGSNDLKELDVSQDQASVEGKKEDYQVDSDQNNDVDMTDDNPNVMELTVNQEQQPQADEDPVCKGAETLSSSSEDNQIDRAEKDIKEEAVIEKSENQGEKSAEVIVDVEESEQIDAPDTVEKETYKGMEDVKEEEKRTTEMADDEKCETLSELPSEKENDTEDVKIEEHKEKNDKIEEENAEKMEKEEVEETHVDEQNKESKENDTVNISETEAQGDTLPDSDQNDENVKEPNVTPKESTPDKDPSEEEPEDSISSPQDKDEVNQIDNVGKDAEGDASIEKLEKQSEELTEEMDDIEKPMEITEAPTNKVTEDMKDSDDKLEEKEEVAGEESNPVESVSQHQDTSEKDDKETKNLTTDQIEKVSSDTDSVDKKEETSINEETLQPESDNAPKTPDSSPVVETRATRSSARKEQSSSVVSSTPAKASQKPPLPSSSLRRSTRKKRGNNQDNDDNASVNSSSSAVRRSTRRKKDETPLSTPAKSSQKPPLPAARRSSRRKLGNNQDNDDNSSVGNSSVESSIGSATRTRSASKRKKKGLVTDLQNIDEEDVLDTGGSTTSTKKRKKNDVEEEESLPSRTSARTPAKASQKPPLSSSSLRRSNRKKRGNNQDNDDNASIADSSIESGIASVSSTTRAGSKRKEKPAIEIEFNSLPNIDEDAKEKDTDEKAQQSVTRGRKKAKASSGASVSSVKSSGSRYSLRSRK